MAVTLSTPATPKLVPASPSTEKKPAVAVRAADKGMQKVAKKTIGAPLVQADQPSPIKEKICCVLKTIAYPFTWLAKKITAFFQRLFGCVPEPYENVNDLIDNEEKLRKEIGALKFDKPTDLITWQGLIRQLDSLDKDVLDRQDKLKKFKEERKQDLESLKDKSLLPDLERKLVACLKKLSECEEQLGNVKVALGDDDDDDDDESGFYGLDVTNPDVHELQSKQERLAAEKEKIEENIARIKSIPSEKEINKVLAKAKGWEGKLNPHINVIARLRTQLEQAVQRHKTPVLNKFQKLQTETLQILQKDQKGTAEEVRTKRLTKYCAYWQMTDLMRANKIFADVCGAEKAAKDHKTIMSVGGDMLWKAIENVNLPNLGNTCWLNSTLQLILINRELIESGQPLPKEQPFNDADCAALARLHRTILHAVCEIWKGNDNAKAAMSELEEVWSDPHLFPDLAKERGEQQDCRTPINTALRAFGQRFFIQNTATWEEEGKNHTKQLNKDGQHSFEVAIRPSTNASKRLLVQDLLNNMSREEMDESPLRINPGQEPQKTVNRWTRSTSIENPSDTIMLAFNLAHFITMNAQKKQELFRFFLTSEGIRNAVSSLPSHESDNKVVEEVFKTLKNTLKIDGANISDEMHRKYAKNYCQDLGLLKKKEEPIVKYLHAHEEEIGKILQFFPDDKMPEAAAQAYLKGDQFRSEKSEQLIKPMEELEKRIRELKPDAPDCQQQILHLLKKHFDQISSLLEITVSDEDYIELNFEELLVQTRTEILPKLKPGTAPEQLANLIQQSTASFIDHLVHYQAAHAYFIKEQKTKVNSPLVFPEEITLPESSPNNKYEVIGCISHWGDTIESGHYIACRSTYDAAQKKLVWREYDDQSPKVKVLTQEEVNARLAKASHVFLKRKKEHKP